MSTAGLMAVTGIICMGALAVFAGIPVWIFAGTPHALIVILACLVVWLLFCGFLRLIGGPE